MDHVYFIRPKGEAGPIKIGKSCSPLERLKKLQIGNPNELELWGAVDADLYPEWWWHQELEPWCVRGEWFSASPQVLSYIEDGLSGRLEPVGGFDPLEDVGDPYGAPEPPQRVPERFLQPPEPRPKYAWPEVDPYPPVEAESVPAVKAAPIIRELLAKQAA